MSDNKSWRKEFDEKYFEGLYEYQRNDSEYIDVTEDVKQSINSLLAKQKKELLGSIWKNREEIKRHFDIEYDDRRNRKGRFIKNLELILDQAIKTLKKI